LLITELRNQNPLSPIEGREFIVQLAEFVSLEQLMNLNRAFSTFMTVSNQTRALSLLNCQVSAIDASTGKFISGVVKKVIFTEDLPKLVIEHKTGESIINMGDISSVTL
jgi:flagellar basal-body rod modification protein FlgD